MVMVLVFHTKDPDGVWGALNIFLFPNLYPLAGSESALLTWKWESILGNGTLTSFADTSLLMGKQKVYPIAGWDEAASQLEAWAVFCMVFLGGDGVHLTTYDMFLLVEETSGVSLRMQAQACQHPTFPVALLFLIHQEFNGSFRKVLERWQRLRWPNFVSLRRTLAKGNFRTELVYLPGGIAPPEQPPPFFRSAPTTGDGSTPERYRQPPTSPGAEPPTQPGGGEESTPRPSTADRARFPESHGNQ